MDLLSYRDTPLHRIDPRAKIIVLIVFILIILSFNKYEISGLVPFIIFPVFLLSYGDIPVGYIIKKIIIVSPFAVMIGIFNPLFDAKTMTVIGDIHISGGWISFFSIMLRFILTVSTALGMIACTGFQNICGAINRLGAPRVFAVQLLFLYRYIFVLTEEGARMLRARNFRSFNGKGKGVKIFGTLLGTLLLRTIGRAERIHLAMLCRGFDGDIKINSRFSFGLNEYLFVMLWSSTFLLFRFVNISKLSGMLITGFFK